MNKAVVVLSGWMDSTTVLYKLLAEKKEVYAISFFYNQKHKIELERAKATCEKLWVSHKIIDISFLNDITENALTNANIEIPKGHYEDESMKQTVVYNRNPIMANIALSYALTIWANEVALWIHSGDHAIYEDCRPEALDALNKTADIWEKGIKFTAPYINTNKAWIIEDWLNLWVDYTLTHTCYEWGEKACGKCWSCQERIEWFLENNIIDPIVYEWDPFISLTGIPQDTEDLISECLKLIEEPVDAQLEQGICIEEFKEKLRNKNIKGYKKYWEFKFENNNMYQMAEEEILDAINYICYELIKLKKLDNKDSERKDRVGEFLSDLIYDYNTLQHIKIKHTEKLDKHFNS